MSADSNSPPSSKLGRLQDLLACGSCGHCIKCKDEDSDYSSGREYVTPQRFPFICFACNKHFESEFFYDLHKLEHSEEKVFDCTVCDEAYTTIEDLTKHKETQHPVDDSENMENVEKEAVYVEVASVQKESPIPANLVHKRRRHKGFASTALLKRRISEKTSDVRTDTAESLERHTSAKQLKLNAFSKTFELKRVLFSQYEELNKKPESLKRLILDQPSKRDFDEPNITMLSLNSSDDYDPDSSSMSTEGSRNKSNSSIDETKGSLFTYLTKAPSISLKPEVGKSRDKRNTLTKRILPLGASCSAPVVSSKLGPPGRYKKRKLRSKLVVPRTPYFEGIDKLSMDDCYFQLPFGEAHKRQLGPNLEVTSTSSSDIIFNIDQLSTNGDPNYQLPSSEANNHKLPPWFSVSPSPLGKGTNETREHSSSDGDQDDPLHSLESSTANRTRRLRGLLKLFPNCNLDLLRTDQPSTSGYERGYQLLLDGSNERQHSFTTISSSNSSIWRAHNTDPSSSSSCYQDCSVSSSEGEYHIPKTMRVECKDGGENVLSSRSLNNQGKAHPRESEKKLKCEVCGKGYKFKWRLREHEKVHTLKTKPTCVDSGKQYYTERRLRDHRRHVCGPDKMKCRFCEKTFSGKYEMNRHEICCHGRSTESTRVKDL